MLARARSAGDGDGVDVDAEVSAPRLGRVYEERGAVRIERDARNTAKVMINMLIPEREEQKNLLRM